MKYILSIAIALLIVFTGFGIYKHEHQTPVTKPTPVVSQPAPPPQTPVIATLINNERVKAGLPALVEDPRLDMAAAAHCADMVRLDEWGHNLSDGTTPQTFIGQALSNEHDFLSGENTTWGWNTSKEVVDKLITSPDHKANILYPKFTSVGYALCNAKDYPNIMVQDFAGL